MLVAQHLFGLDTLQQAPTHESTQDAFTQGGLCLGHSGVIDFTDRVKDDALGGEAVASVTPCKYTVFRDT